MASLAAEMETPLSFGVQGFPGHMMAAWLIITLCKTEGTFAIAMERHFHEFGAA